MNDRRERAGKMPHHGHTRPAAPPPPPPASKPFMGGSGNNSSGGGKEKKMQHESRNAYAVALTGNAAPSSEAVTDAYRGQQHSQRRPGVNNRTVAGATGHCNGNSVPVQPQDGRLNTTSYEVYHIHRQPNSRSSQPHQAYCYLPASSASKHNKDLSQGSCDNTPATPDSLDSLGGSDTSAVSSSSALNRLQSDDEASGQGTSTFDNHLEADNNNTIKPERHRERDNLIEELTTLITATRPYRRDEQTPSPQVSSSSPASTPDNQDKTMSSSSSSSSNQDALSSSLTPSTVVRPPSNTTLTANAMSSPVPRRYYFEGGSGGSGCVYGRGQPGHARQPAASPKQEVPVYEQLTSTMLRRSRSQQFQGKSSSSLSVGNTPPLTAKHVMNSHYMPLQAYQQHVPAGVNSAAAGNGSGYRRPYHYQDTRRSNPQIHYATELVLTPHQAQQIQQSLVNRYSTVGRNFHISVGCDQQTAIKADIHQRPTAMPQSAASVAAAPPVHQATPHPESLAMRINNNLIKGQTMTMSNKELPLADVRRLPEVATPTTISMTSKRLSSEDILSAESTTECCDEDGRLSPDEEPEPAVHFASSPPPPSRPTEEERVRKHTLLSTLVMPRPQRKPPFTIEAAMNKLLGRTKKKETASNNAAEPASSKKTETNRRRLKASPSPKKAVVTNGASDEATASGTSVLDNNSMVRKLRQAGSDTTSNAFGEDRGLLPSDEEATLPDYSDNDVIKKKIQVIFSSSSYNSGSLEPSDTLNLLGLKLSYTTCNKMYIKCKCVRCE